MIAVLSLLKRLSCIKYGRLLFFYYYCWVVLVVSYASYLSVAGEAEKDANCKRFMDRALPECFQKVMI